MTKIELSVPRRDVDLLVDLFHLNGYVTDVVKTGDTPASITVHIPEEGDAKPANDLTFSTNPSCGVC